MSSARAITERQAEALAAIEAHIKEVGRPPTLQELADRLGVSSTNTVREFLLRLEQKGYVTRDSSVSRGLQLTGKAA